jgi:hypothetical protein
MIVSSGSFGFSKSQLYPQVKQSGKEMLGSRKFQRFHGSNIPGRNISAFPGGFRSNPCSFQWETVGIQWKNPECSDPEYCFRFHRFPEFSCKKRCFFLVSPTGSDRFWKAE